MMGKLRNNCFEHNGKLLTHAEALTLLQLRLAPVATPEQVPLAEAADRILAVEVTAPRNIPAHDYSAMDGYVFAHAGYDSANGTWFELSGRAAAGHVFGRPAEKGEALRILTGAVIPEGTDTVAMQEDVRLEGSRVFVPGGLERGANRRLAGEDVRAGAIVAAPGLRLRPQNIAAIAATGTGTLTCYRRLRVAIMSTGDELVQTGQPLKPGQIYDTNGPMVAALAANAGVEVIGPTHVEDNAEAVREALSSAAKSADAIFVSGGAGYGDEDYVAQTVKELGSLHLWQLAIKPGKPVSFGQIGNCTFIGLPGNPVSSFVCFLLYAAPALNLLGGGTWREPRRYALPSAFAIPSRKTGRREFLRGTLVEGTGGGLVVQCYPRDGSGLISSLQASEGLIEIGEDVGGVALGDVVRFIPYVEFGI